MRFLSAGSFARDPARTQCYKLHQVKFTWVKGHAGHPENERCDVLAVNASKSKELKIDSVFEVENKVNQSLI